MPSLNPVNKSLEPEQNLSREHTLYSQSSRGRASPSHTWGITSTSKEVVVGHPIHLAFCFATRKRCAHRIYLSEREREVEG